MSNISNDSGLDDSAICGVASNAGPAAAATRLSWFLAEVDEGSMQDGKPNGKRRLCVLHSMELLESDVSDKYMTRLVDFRINGNKVEAKLILAADDRKLVDAALVSMSKEQLDEEDSRKLLVQYNEEDAAGNRLVQKIVPPQSVVWLSTKHELNGTPLVKLGPRCIGHVLYAYEKREFMEKVLLHLKARCFDHAFDEELDASQEPMDEKTWLLVQYSPDPETVVYQVIPYSQTVWRHENLFKDVIAYVQLPHSEVVLQAVVITYSRDQQNLLGKYDQLRRFAVLMEFPQREDLEEQLQQGVGTAGLFARTSNTLFQRAEQRDVTGEHKQLRRSLQKMSEKAQSEAEMIINAFDMVDNINKNLKGRLGDAPVEVISSDEMQ